ncbi:hypothetical protein EYF80_027633 [Liparis tanakae]|uniref:Uncharacterized protein n=1 Tax=Liparis tanakae TaxID=230148 RepID=A0A4Z2HAW0_9TELE|nr:hypothetical protein EYF80_027633 [Liparis tanakae]
MSRAHEKVVGDFAKGQSQVDDIIFCAAALGEVADVDDSPSCGFSGLVFTVIPLHLFPNSHAKKTNGSMCETDSGLFGQECRISVHSGTFFRETRNTNGLVAPKSLRAT